MKRTVMFGTFLVIAGFVIAGSNLAGVWLQQHSAVRSAHVSQALHDNPIKNLGGPLIAGTPVHITIPSVGIDLSVVPGDYNPADQSWTLTLTNAQYANITAKPNNKEGDTFIYAHARAGLFQNLPQIQTGAKAIVTTGNNHVFTYSFEKSVITSPQDASLFSYTGKPILVLQTCTGLWWQDRQLFTFSFSSVK